MYVSHAMEIPPFSFDDLYLIHVTWGLMMSY